MDVCCGGALCSITKLLPSSEVFIQEVQRAGQRAQGGKEERCRIETSQDENSHLFSDLKEVSSHTY